VLPRVLAANFIVQIVVLPRVLAATHKPSLVLGTFLQLNCPDPGAPSRARHQRKVWSVVLEPPQLSFQAGTAV
jgi:hypothetical protein